MKPKELQSIISQFKKKRITVLGDVGVDRYTFGAVERISPEAPVPIVQVFEEKHKLGLAANVADNIATLGGTPVLVGLIGRDGVAQELKQLMKSARVGSLTLVTDPARRTSLKERIVSDRQQLLRVDYESTHHPKKNVQSALVKKVISSLSKSQALIIEDYAKGMMTKEMIAQVIRAAKKSGVLTLVDPNAKSTLDMYQGADVITPNRREAEALVGFKVQSEKDLLEAGSIMLSEVGGEHVFITLGKDGMAIFSRGGKKAIHIPTYAREVYDVSGAGDTVIATLALALSSGASIHEAAMIANLAAGVVVGKRGTATVTPKELAQMMSEVL
ncbi:MAG: D-glycero-beta-D-manno-heptose-7-phosphate kinase [Xanthomonadaceae bacterium]|nr:D-glycero-beta-D-manno-heptose-7-phosphate kinase [Xanthomonadaceae bacterium]